MATPEPAVHNLYANLNAGKILQHLFIKGFSDIRTDIETCFRTQSKTLQAEVMKSKQKTIQKVRKERQLLAADLKDMKEHQSEAIEILKYLDKLSIRLKSSWTEYRKQQNELSAALDDLEKQYTLKLRAITKQAAEAEAAEIKSLQVLKIKSMKIFSFVDQDLTIALLRSSKPKPAKSRRNRIYGRKPQKPRSWKSEGLSSRSCRSCAPSVLDNKRSQHWFSFLAARNSWAVLKRAFRDC